MLAIRSGVPLALQNKRKRKKLKDFPLKISSKKGDLGVRKDLTLPSAPTPGEDNVFRVRLLKAHVLYYYYPELFASPSIFTRTTAQGTFVNFL